MISEDVCAFVIDQILEVEGGIADVHDGSGVTYYGQTKAWLDSFGLPIPLNPEEARTNYLAWMSMTRLDELSGIDRNLCWAVTDWAVNAGHIVAIRSLQKALGVSQDGRIGPDTIGAARTSDGLRVALHVSLDRIRFYGHLATSDVSKLKFLNGWLNRSTDQLAAICGVSLD